jgi:NADH-quinone oxidoreductase subunit G
MPTVTIDDRTIEVERGTNLIEAAKRVGVQIPHYCYHPRLSVVGQCRMCLVQVDGSPKLAAGCASQVMKDGMVVRTDVPEVEEAQRGMMEFFLINHPLDCPICDQAGECGLQDYAFKHGVAFSRFHFEDKRTYPGRERIPLGANVLLNMNRCIQCTRCIRFTHEVSKTGELGFFDRGARTEIGTFPGKPLDNPLATNVVDICPVGALTSTRFRFAERVWYLTKEPSICTGCDAGCNVTLEHRRGRIRRYKPRFNPEVNDYWMCDYGRGTFERYGNVGGETPRHEVPRVTRGGRPAAASWRQALDTVHAALAEAKESGGNGKGEVAILGSGHLTVEEAYLLARLAEHAGAHRAVAVEPGPERWVPNPEGGVTGREDAPNRRGAELAGLGGSGGDRGSAGFSAADLLEGDAAAGCAVLIVAGHDLSAAAHDPATVERLRRARFLVVAGWADTPLAKAADVALPLATHAEQEGTFVNSQWRLQRFEECFPSPGEARPGVEALGDLLARFDPEWRGLGPAEVFDRLAAAVPAFAGLGYQTLPPTGAPLAVPES